MVVRRDHPVPTGCVGSDAKPTTSVGPMDDMAAMGLAIDEARIGGERGEVPVGAVVLADGEVIARAHNQREQLQDPSAHAEVVALRAAAASLGRWHLDGLTLVVTLEPCLACAGTMLNGRLDRVVFGADNLEAGACGSLYNVCDDPRLNHSVVVTPRVRVEECAQLLTDFFAARR